MEINPQERNIGFEPMTSTLARLRSTTELIPQIGSHSITPIQRIDIRTNGPKENRTLHSLLAKQSRQPWYM